MPDPNGGERIALVLLKEGLSGLLKVAAKAAALLLHACASAMRLSWQHRASLLDPILKAPKMLARLVNALLSTRAGKAFVAACTSLLCIQVRDTGGRYTKVPSL
jgi:hypothetical protein